MNHRFYLIALYDIYGDLLTDKQKKYFEDYYFNNFTLSELGQNYNVTRTAIHNQLKETEEKLEHFENILKIYKKNNQIKNIIKELDEKTKEEIESIL